LQALPRLCLLSLRRRLKQRKVLAAIAVTVAILAAVGAFILPPILPRIFRPWASLEGKVHYFVIHYRDGLDATISPEDPEGKRLTKLCEDVINHFDGVLTLMTTDEMVKEMMRQSDYIDVVLKATYKFDFYVEGTEVQCNVEAKRIVFMLGGYRSGIVMFDGKPWGGQVCWGYNFGVNPDSQCYKELVNAFHQLRALAEQP